MIRIVYRDPESQREVQSDFETDHIRVGREGGNELVLPYMEVSRYHAEFLVSGEAVTLLDRSTNGTFGNGVRVFGKQILNVGDRVGIGNVVLSVYTEQQLQQAWDEYNRAQAAASQGQYPA